MSISALLTMDLIRFLVISALLSAYIVSASYHDVAHLKENFIANLIEENRGIASSELTDDIERAINLKIEGFLSVFGEPTSRPRRDATEQLIDGKTTDIVVLKGFESRGFIPVNFPQDLCMFQINQKIFAVGLSYGKISNGTSDNVKDLLNELTIFYRENGKFRKIHEYKSKFLTKVDCKASGGSGFVAVVNSVDTSNVKELLQYGSFVIRVTLEATGEPKVETLQTIAKANQNSVRLWSRSENLYLVYSYDTSVYSQLNLCTVFKLEGTNFNPIDNLPCQNARVIEFFTCHHNLMVLIGNYRENNGTTNTFSTIMRYDLNQNRFVEHQKISTQAITVGRYFYLDHQDQRQHFLFIGNSFELNEFGVINYDVPSMIYKLVNMFFIPMQTISVKHVQAVLPILGKNNEFHLLIASEEREVQIYFYDGWKFHESPIDFTGDAFGSGVVRMRAFDDIINGTTTIVISNQDSFDPTWNVYSPIYAIRNDTSKLQSSIVKWCSDTLDKLEAFDPADTEQLLRSSLELVDPSTASASFLGKISLNGSEVQTITTKEFKFKNTSFNMGTAERVIALSDRASKLANAVNHVANKIRFTKATRRVRRQAPMLVKSLTVDGPIKVQTINGRPISDLVYKSGRRNAKMDIIANEILIKKELKVNEKIDGLELREDNVLLNKPRQVLRPLTIEKLTAKNVFEVAQLNAMPIDEFFKLLRLKVDQKIPNMIHQLTVDSMTIGRFLNQRNFTAMLINSLKTVGDQVLTGPTTINKLKVNNVGFRKMPRFHQISGIHLMDLVNVNSTENIMINHDMQFINELSANRLTVLERINNVMVKDGRLQVLRKRGPTQQRVTGEKFFDNVHLMSPILLQGKIESKTLEKMNPIVTISESLVLVGDYRINGPVRIRRIINVTEDIATSNPKLGLRNLVDNGLNLFTSTRTSNQLTFKNVVEVKGNLQATSLNQKPVANFIKSNFEELQKIQGVTKFTNGLFVEGGTVQVDVINDINVFELNKTVLKLSSTATQFIDGNVEFVSLKAHQLVSQNVSLNDKNLDLVLTTNTPQSISEMVVTHSRVGSAGVGELKQQPGGKIFGTDLNFLISDTVTKNNVGSSFIANKTFIDLKVEHLTFSDANEWKSIINNYENSLSQDLNITGDMVLKNQMRVGNLEVTGTINKISYDDMTRNWLQVEGDQTFAAPQTFASVEVGNNLVIANAAINDVNIGRMINESIWIDEPVYVKIIEFKNTIRVNGKMMTPMVNGMSLESKLILNNTNDVQTIPKLTVNGFVAVEYLNFTEVNGIDCAKVMETFEGTNGTAAVTIRGGASFIYPPNVTSINTENLQQLHDSVWMADKDVELTGDDIQFLMGVRSDGAIYADTINKNDLDIIFQSYFSKTRNQNIVTYLNVNGTAIVKKALVTQKTIVLGAIKSDVGDKGLKIDDFAKKILRHGQEQTIAGNWNIAKLIIEGNYTGTINGLDFHNDVLHTGNWDTAEVAGSKEFRAIEAYDVKTQFVNGIDVNDWLTNAVQLNSSAEQAIAGLTSFRQAVFYDDLQVLGTVNGLTINPDTVLTKSGEGQVITGDLTIETMTAHGAKPSFIDQLFLRFGINGKNFTELFLNTLKRSDTKINSKRLVFEDTLSAGTVDTEKSMYGVNMAEFLRSSDISNKLVKFQNNLRYLTRVGNSLQDSFRDSAVELSHFDHHQLLQGDDIQKTISLASGKDHFLAVHERNLNTSFEVIRFYRWSNETKSFVDDGSALPLQYSMASYQITKLSKVTYKRMDHLFVEIFDKTAKTFFQNLMLLDPTSKTFTVQVELTSEFSSQFFMLDNGAGPCFGYIYPSFENLNIFCDGQPTTVLKTAPIRMASSQNGIIILLTDDHQLQVWYQLKIRQVLKVMNPQSFTSIRYGEKFYLVVSSDKVEQSIHHGGVEIFESGDDIQFKLVQSFELENPFLVQFTEIPSGDLLLYILTRNPGKTFNVYKYAGASYFVETIGISTIVNTASDLCTISIDDHSEFIAVVSKDIFIIEAVMKEY